MDFQVQHNALKGKCLYSHLRMQGLWLLNNKIDAVIQF